ncbi:MAG: hypothetical protein COA78_28625 [Blastopirellula sp.]|nr:MAG: hypothetical protein COA78_28625 [Blastopirellula sp.]
MRDRFLYSYFSIEPAIGWTASVCGTEIEPYVSIVPDSGDVELRLAPPSADALPMEPQQWVEKVAEINRIKRREVSAVTCGDFSGCNVQFELNNGLNSDGFTSAWALFEGSRSLSAYYHSPKVLQGRDDDAIYEMLCSLKVVL